MNLHFGISFKLAQLQIPIVITSDARGSKVYIGCVGENWKKILFIFSRASEYPCEMVI
jgi:hypothetical protein